MAGEKDAKAAAELAENTKLAGEYAEEALGAFQQQLKVVSQMRDAMEQVAKVMYALCQQDCKALNPDVWKKVTKEVIANGKATSNTTNSVKKLAEAYEKNLLKALTLTVAVFNGFLQGLRNVTALGKSAFGFITSVADAFYEVGKSIISIPFKMIEALFSMATKGGSNELMAALEAVRKDFGDLSKNAGKAIVTTAKSMNSMKEYGLSALRIFGDLAARVKAVHEMANEMGDAFDHFKGEVNKSGVEMMLFKKGLGLTAEAMQGIASQAIRTGKPITEIQKEMTVQSQAMSKQFGVTAKIIAKDMGKAMADLAHFGHLSSKEMAVAATFARQMGVSIDKLTAIMDATKTYDQTVDSMSKLNETFGTNIDFMKIMQAQTPTEQMQILREEFAKTGKDMSQLNRFERDLIKQATNMDDAMLNAAFSTKNASVSLDAMTKAAEKNAKTVTTTKDAIKSLKDEIDAITPPAGKEYKGPFDAFFDGILRGIQTAPEFIALMNNIRATVRVAIQEGYALGRAFVNAFPGVKEVLGGLKDMFDPVRWRKLFHSLTEIFNEFASTGSQDVGKVMDKIQGVFMNFFEEGKPANTKFMNGLKKFGQALLHILVEGVKYAFSGLKSIYDDIMKELSDPSPGTLALMSSIRGMVTRLSSFIVEEVTPFVRNALMAFTNWLQPDELKKNFPADSKIVGAFTSIFEPLGVALKDAWKQLEEPIKQLVFRVLGMIKDALWAAFKDAPWWVQTYIITQMFGPAALPIVAMLVAKLGPKLLSAISSGLASLVGADFFAGFTMAFQGGFTQALEGGVIQSIKSQGLLQTARTAMGSFMSDIGIMGAGGATAAFLGVGTALVGGIFAGLKLDEHFNEKYKEAAEKINKETDEFYQKLELIQDPKRRIEELQKEYEKKQEAVKDASGRWARFKDKVWGTGDELGAAQRAADAAQQFRDGEIRKLSNQLKDEEEKKRKAMAEATQDTPEWVAKMEAERNKQIEEEKAKSLAALGPVTIENAAERFKKIEELSKQVMSSDFNIGDRIKEVREKLEAINWTLVSPEIENKINTSVVTLEKVSKAMAAIADIGSLTNVAGDKLAESSKKFAADSEELKAIGKGGAVESVINAATNSFKDLDATAVATAKVKAQMAADLFETVIKISDNTKALTEKVANTTAEAAITSFATTLKTVEDMVATVQKMDNALANLDNINIGTRLTGVANSLGLGAKGVYTVQSKDVVIHVNFNVTMDAKELETIMISNKESIIRDRINFLIDNTQAAGSPDAAQAAIKSVAPQSGPLASYFP